MPEIAIILTNSGSGHLTEKTQEELDEAIAATLISSGNNGCNDILDKVKIQQFEVSYYGDSDDR